MDKTDKSVALQWSRGADNGSPISKYSIQYRDSFSGDVWTAATTGESVSPAPSSWLIKQSHLPVVFWRRLKDFKYTNRGLNKKKRKEKKHCDDLCET